MLNYIKLNVPNWETMRSELKEMSKEFLDIDNRKWDISSETMNKKCPVFMDFLNSRRKKEIDQFRILRTKPLGIIWPHFGEAAEIGFNFPLWGENDKAIMEWFDTPPDNIIETPEYYQPRQVVDIKKCQMVDCMTYDVPTFVRTVDVHGAHYTGKVPKLTLRVAFKGLLDLDKIDDSFDTSGLR